MEKSKVLKSLFVLLFFVAGTFLWNLSAASYEPDFDVEEFILNTTDVKITKDKTTYIFTPEKMESGVPATGFIFYPGGKVKYEAYIPLLTEIARKGIVCVMPKMHHDLAIYNITAAEKVINSKRFMEIDSWYIGGHSLGGAMASVWAEDNPTKVKGVILLAAFSTKNLSKSNLNVISIYGSCDTILNQKSYQKYRKNLPENFTEYILDGGNHSNFGNYGLQRNDTVPKLTRESQQNLTAEILEKSFFSVILK